MKCFHTLCLSLPTVNFHNKCLSHRSATMTNNVPLPSLIGRQQIMVNCNHRQRTSPSTISPLPRIKTTEQSTTTCSVDSAVAMDCSQLLSETAVHYAAVLVQLLDSRLASARSNNKQQFLEKSLNAFRSNSEQCLAHDKSHE